MKNIDYRIWIGLAIHVLICLIGLAEDDKIRFYITFPFVILNFIGIGLIFLNKTKAGCIVFMVGSAVFIPIGIIGFFGARKMLNDLKQKDFYEEINTIGNDTH